MFALGRGGSELQCYSVVVPEAVPVPSVREGSSLHQRDTHIFFCVLSSMSSRFIFSMRLSELLNAAACIALYVLFVVAPFPSPSRGAFGAQFIATGFYFEIHFSNNF